VIVGNYKEGRWNCVQYHNVGTTYCENHSRSEIELRPRAHRHFGICAGYTLKEFYRERVSLVADGGRVG